MKDDFYIPYNWRKQDIKNKQGSVYNGNWNPKIDTYDQDGALFETATTGLENICEKSYYTYKAMIDKGVAKEMARMILPVNLYTEIYVNCDLHNLIHFFHLRLDEHAQWEIRQYAIAMFEIFKDLYPWTAEAYSRYKLQIIDDQENK